MYAEDSIQGPKADGCVTSFRQCCGNLAYLRCKCLKELKEREEQVSEEVCCSTGEGGRALNDNTEAIQLLAPVFA